MELVNGKNPFEGLLERFKIEQRKINPIHYIVNHYYEMRGWSKMQKEFYTGNKSYGKLCSEAKELYIVLNSNLEDCLWALEKMKYLADKGNFDWSISTCLKHKKL